MTGPGRLRLFVGRPQGPAVDVVLRDVVAPALLQREALVDVFMARRGADGDDERVIVTVWSGGGQTETDLEQDLLVAGGVTFAEDERPGVETMPLRIALRHDRRVEPAVLRVFRGSVRDGHFESYLDAARSGALFDGATNAGAVALYLGAADAPRFVTVSAWVDWNSIESATGGDIRRPFATRHQELLDRVDATHYEIIPNIPRPAAEMQATLRGR